MFFLKENGPFYILLEFLVFATQFMGLSNSNLESFVKSRFRVSYTKYSNGITSIPILIDLEFDDLIIQQIPSHQHGDLSFSWKEILGVEY
jgi:hypothetical protein